MEKKSLFVIGVLVLIIGGAFIFWPMLQDRTVSVVVNERVERPDVGISFAFPSGEQAYSYIEPTPGTSTSRTPRAVFLMMKTDEYTEFLKAPEGREAPKSMSIFVYDEIVEETPSNSPSTTTPDRITKIRAWAEAHSEQTLYTLARGAPEELKIDGAKALHYQADGLYLNDVYVTFYQNRYYVIVGQYDGDADPAKGVFTDLVHSIMFI